MKHPSDLYAPIEFCRTSELYPFYLHVFHMSVDKKPLVIPRHWHKNIEITYRLKYKGTLYINGRELPLTDDSLYIINSCDIHEIHSDLQEELYAVLLSISYDFLKKVVPNIENLQFQAGAHEAQMKKIILKMKQEQETGGIHSYLMQNSLIYEFIYYMMEDVTLLKHSSEQLMTSRVRKRKKEIMSYLDEHIAEISSVSELSSVFGYSREYFSRFIKQYFGISCQELLMEARLSLALWLLTNTNDSLEQISRKAGFPSLRTFSRNFRIHYGQKPESFLKYKV